VNRAFDRSTPGCARAIAQIDRDDFRRRRLADQQALPLAGEEHGGRCEQEPDAMDAAPSSSGRFST